MGYYVYFFLLLPVVCLTVPINAVDVSFIVRLVKYDTDRPNCGFFDGVCDPLFEICFNGNCHETTLYENTNHIDFNETNTMIFFFNTKDIQNLSLVVSVFDINGKGRFEFKNLLTRIQEELDFFSICNGDTQEVTLTANYKTSLIVNITRNSSMECNTVTTVARSTPKTATTNAPPTQSYTSTLTRWWTSSFTTSTIPTTSNATYRWWKTSPTTTDTTLRRRCQSTYFQCRNGRCISKNWLCDGDDDCTDNSDEIMCVRTTTRNTLTSSTLRRWWAFITSTTSTAPLFITATPKITTATPSSTSTLRRWWTSHFTTSTTSAPTSRLSEMFQCRNGRYIYKQWQCDGYNDCRDNSDEYMCVTIATPKRTTATPSITEAARPKITYTTPLSSYTLRRWWTSNSTPPARVFTEATTPKITSTTPSSSSTLRRWWTSNSTSTARVFQTTAITTPSPPTTRVRICQYTQFQCRNGRCININYQCDGDNDCRDNSDEIMCANATYRWWKTSPKTTHTTLSTSTLRRWWTSTFTTSSTPPPTNKPIFSTTNPWWTRSPKRTDTTLSTSTLRGWWSSTFTPSSTPTPPSTAGRWWTNPKTTDTTISRTADTWWTKTKRTDTTISTSTLRRWWTSILTRPSTSTTPTTPLYTSYENYVDVNCGESNWYIRLYIRPLKQQFQGFNAGDVYLGRDSCTGYESGDYIIFSEEYNSCLTDKSTSNEAVIYTNTLVYALHDPDHRFIIRDYRFKVKVECDMSKREHGVDTIKHNHGHEDHTAAGTGHFSIHLNFYSDSKYQNRFNGFPPAYVVGDVVYVKVQTSMHDYDVKMRLSDCYTKPSEHASTIYTYYLIQNGCPVDRNTFVTSQSTHETRFHFQDFEYAGHPDSMFVHCNATFCKSNDYSSACEPQCKHSNRIGHHRSAVQNLNGPIEISDVETKILFTDKRDSTAKGYRRNSDSSNESSSKFKPLYVAGVIIVAVAMICVLVALSIYFRRKKIRNTSRIV